MQAVTSHFIDASGIRTHYLECGDAGSPPLVLIHGGGAGATAAGNWRAAMPLFAENFRVIAVEMVGFGQTDKPDSDDYEYSQDNRNRHLAAFIDAMQIAPVPLVGNSMGGATALGVAMNDPDLVAALVLMGSAGLNAQITPALEPVIKYDFTYEGMRRLVDTLTGSRFDAPEDVIRSRHEDSTQPQTRAAYGKIMQWIGAQGGLFYDEADIAAVKTKSLVVNGKEDIVVPLENAYRFLELLDNSHGYIIPHVGHWVMIEAAEEFADVVTRFLSRG